MQNQVTNYQFYAVIDSENDVIGFTLKENNYPWFLDTDRQPNKIITDPDGIFKYKCVNGEIIKKTDSEIESDKLVEIKRNAIYWLSQKTTERIQNGEIEIGGIKIKLNQYANENFRDLNQAVTSGIYDTGIRGKAEQHFGKPLPADTIMAIAKAIANYKLDRIIEHDETEQAILSASTIDDINTIISNY